MEEGKLAAIYLPPRNEDMINTLRDLLQATYTNEEGNKMPVLRAANRDRVVTVLVKLVEEFKTDLEYELQLDEETSRED